MGDKLALVCEFCVRNPVDTAAEKIPLVRSGVDASCAELEFAHTRIVAPEVAKKSCGSAWYGENPAGQTLAWLGVLKGGDDVLNAFSQTTKVGMTLSGLESGPVYMLLDAGSGHGAPPA
jgi:hypothetical protein